MCQLSPSNYSQADPRPAGLIWTHLSIISWMYCLGGSVILCSKWIIPISAQSPAVLARFFCHHHLQAPNALRVGWKTENYGDSSQMFAWANSPDFLGTKHLILFGHRLFIYVPQAVILLLCLGKKACQYQSSPDFFLVCCIDGEAVDMTSSGLVLLQWSVPSLPYAGPSLTPTESSVFSCLPHEEQASECGNRESTVKSAVGVPPSAPVTVDFLVSVERNGGFEGISNNFRSVF